MVKSKGIGIKGIEPPENKCSDSKCPWHGKLSVRGRVFTGRVISDRMTKTTTVEWPRIVRLKKYKRYMKKRSRVKAHNPECINAKTGNEVVIMECRPLSKTKKFVILKVNEK